MLNETNIVAPRVPLIDERTGLISREWYRFFLNLFVLTGSGANVTSLLDLQVGPPAVTVDEFSRIITKISENLSPSQDGLLAQIAELQKQIQALEIQKQPELGTLSGIQQDDVPWLKFHNEPVPTPVGTGSVFWDGGTTLNLVMTPSVTQKIGEDQYFYIKASGAITKGQLIMFTGAVGASGVVTGAPATGVTDGQYLVGVAAENIALNNFGLVTDFGALRNIDTSIWADGDVLYNDPATPGGLSNVLPSAPNVKATVAVVTKGGSAGGGSIFVRMSAGSVLGGTDSNVQFTSLSDGDIIDYNATLGYWQNAPATSVQVVSWLGL